MSSNASHANTRQTSRSRQSSASPAASRRASTSKASSARGSVSSSSLHSASLSMSSHRSSSRASSSSESSTSDSLSLSAAKADKFIKDMKKRNERDLTYWTQRADSTASTDSATSSVFADMAGDWDNLSRNKLLNKLLKQLEVIGQEMSDAMGDMWYTVPLPIENPNSIYDGQRHYSTYKKYAIAARDACERFQDRDWSDEVTQYFNPLSRKTGRKQTRGESLIFRLFPVFVKDLADIQTALAELTTNRKDGIRVEDIRSLLARTRAHLTAYKDCEDVQEYLLAYRRSRGAVY